MLEEKTLSFYEVSKYHLIDEISIDKELTYHINKFNKKIIILDDDPTGIQTVNGISVYTDWSEESIREGFHETNKLFYILTNSRGLTREQTIRCHKEIIECIERVSDDLEKEYIILSRGDSTLRGHYPLETEILKEGFEKSGVKKVDGEIICPFFKEGGRYTLNNVHYVKVDEILIPAAQTEFAKDKTFGYSSSNICEYIEEKTKGNYKAVEVITISLEDLRNCKVDKIVEQLMQVKDFNKIVVNAIDYCDLKVFILALYKAMERGKNYMFRVAAAFVKVIGGIQDKPLLTKKDMIEEENHYGGIIVIGSYTKKTTSQLEALRELEGIEFIEFNSDLVLDDIAFKKEFEGILKREEAYISQGKTVVVYTKRKLLEVTNDTKEEVLLRSVKISNAVQALVGELTVTPSFIIAKGGITSSDVGTKALKVKRAHVLGQIRPGIPVWQTGKESKFPHIPYVIFPGNVGEATTLKEAVEILIS